MGSHTRLMPVGKSADPSFGRWNSYEIVRRELVELPLQLRGVRPLSGIRPQNVDIIKLLLLMVFDESLQRFLSDR